MGSSSGSFPGQIDYSATHFYYGSPLPFHAASYGSRFYPGMSPGQLLGPLDPNELELEFGKMTSSIESDRDSTANAFATIERQDKLCRDYTCCGLNLTDLHALVDHFEECHVTDPYTPQQNLPPTLPPSTSSPHNSETSYYSESCGGGPFDPTLKMEMEEGPSTSNQQQQAVPYQDTCDLDDIELDVDQSTSTPSSAPSSHASQPTSPGACGRAGQWSRMPIYSALGGCWGCPMRVEDALNAYAGYSDYSSLLPGAAPLGSGPNVMSAMSLGRMNGQNGQAVCAPAALLLSNTAGNTPDSTPASSCVASPTLALDTSSESSNSGASPQASTTLSGLASSLLPSKPFRCPSLNCSKSYKQANGLKYHRKRGSCDPAPPMALEHVQELLTSKHEKAKAAGENGVIDAEVMLSDADLREVKKEVERWLRPYACVVGDCQRRYKTMDGLRYHYKHVHSGDWHGASGWALLASRQHECFPEQPNLNKSPHTTPSSPSNSMFSSNSSTPAPRTPSQSVSVSKHAAAAFAHLPSYQNAMLSPPSYGQSSY